MEGAWVIMSLYFPHTRLNSREISLPASCLRVWRCPVLGGDKGECVPRAAWMWIYIQYVTEKDTRWLFLGVCLSDHLFSLSQSRTYSQDRIQIESSIYLNLSIYQKSVMPVNVYMDISRCLCVCGRACSYVFVGERARGCVETKTMSVERDCTCEKD